MNGKVTKLCVYMIGCMCAMFCLFACQQKNVRIKEDESFFSSFKVENGKVYMYCTLFIENPTGIEKNITLQARFEDDAENGLLKEGFIDGYSIDESTQCFCLQSGKNQVEVVFIGEHAGKYQKHDRALPSIKIEEIN